MDNCWVCWAFVRLAKCWYICIHICMFRCVGVKFVVIDVLFHVVYNYIALDVVVFCLFKWWVCCNHLSVYCCQMFEKEDCVAGCLLDFVYNYMFVLHLFECSSVLRCWFICIHVYICFDVENHVFVIDWRLHFVYKYRIV